MSSNGPAGEGRGYNRCDPGVGGGDVIELFDTETEAPLGAISEAQLQFLIDQLEEESPDDTDYYINQATLDMLEERGADPSLVTLLRHALGAREDMEIRWERKG